MKTMLRWDLAITLLLFGFFAYHLHRDNAEKVHTYHQERVRQMQMQYDTILKAQSGLADLLFSTRIDKEEVLLLMARAERGDETEQAALRKALYETLLPLYRELRHHGIPYLHFHTSDSRSFLRFDHPDHYGDDLSAFRRSVVRANRELKTVRVFEAGRFYNGFRNVYPLRYRGEHVGSVELSFSFSNIRDYLNHVSPADYDFIVKKELLETNLLASERSRYKPCDLCSAYLFDSAVAAANPPGQVGSESRRRIMERLAETLKTRTERGSSFSLSPELEERYYALTCLSVKDLQKRHIAYILSMSEDPMMGELQLSYKKSLLLVGLFTLFFATVAYLLYLRKYQSDAFWRASLDYQTRAYDHRSCQEHIIRLVRFHQSEGQSCSLAILGIDGIDLFRKTHGEESAEQILAALAALLQGTVRSSDLICRWSDDAFIVVLDTDLETAEHVAEKIRMQIEKHPFENAGHLTASIGLTELEPDDTEEACFKRADLARYRAKERGGNCSVTYG